ncbi:hypothetical protein ACO2KS_14680 [Leptospira terpstrae]|uniref:hypothetical protein n=2 Tax=Leptospira terpstrae TaxID=293075 RepID=UPI003CFC3663
MRLSNFYCFLLFSFFLNSCNGQSTKNDMSSLAFLSFLGNPSNATLEDKFQTVQLTTFYRKDGNLQFQDILIEYQLKTAKAESESVEASMGNPNEIAYNPNTNQVAGHLQRQEDLYQTNSLVFTHSDFSRKFKIFLTLKKDGKILSVKELTTTPPNPPAIPPNTIALPTISYETKRTLFTSGGIPTEYQVIYIKFQAGADLSAYTRLDAYIGRPNLISLAPDNYNVINYIKVSSYDKFSGYFLFLTPELNSAYKVIVVGSTAEAKGNRSIDTVPPPPPPSPCVGSVTAPTTIGNCATHCLLVDLVGNQMEYTAKTSIGTTAEEYLYIDSTSSTVSGGTGPANFAFTEHFSPIGIGTYQTDPRSFDVTTYNNACIVLSSYLVQDGPGGFRDSYLTGKVTVP